MTRVSRPPRTRGTRIHFHSFAEYVVAPSHPSAESSGLPVANNSTSQHTYTHAEATDMVVDIVDIALAPGVDELDSRILPPFTEPTVPHPQQQIAVTRNLVTIINPEPGMRPATVLLGHSGADVGHTRGESIIRRSLCPITGHPAKYRDPLTGTPYATVEAFAAIRQIATGAVVWDAGTTIFHDKTPSDL